MEEKIFRYLSRNSAKLLKSKVFTLFCRPHVYFKSNAFSGYKKFETAKVNSLFCNLSRVSTYLGKINLLTYDSSDRKI